MKTISRRYFGMTVNYDSQEYLKSVDAYWRAANYLSVIFNE